MFSDIWGMHAIISLLARLVNTTDVSKIKELSEENDLVNEKDCFEKLVDTFNETITEFNKINTTLFQKRRNSYG